MEELLTESDLRKKKKMQIIDNALDRLKQIHGYTFDFIGNDEEHIGKKHMVKRHAGVIAQEIEKVLPEVVFEDKEGMKSVAYGNLIALLIQSVKELELKCEQLQMKVDKKVGS